MIDVIIGGVAVLIVVAVIYLYMSGKRKPCGDSCDSCPGCNAKDSSDSKKA